MPQDLRVMPCRKVPVGVSRSMAAKVIKTRTGTELDKLKNVFDDALLVNERDFQSVVIEWDAHWRNYWKKRRRYKLETEVFMSFHRCFIGEPFKYSKVDIFV